MRWLVPPEMPANLPVPSKNALRALRHLALGTSCTLAVGAGLLTEDRRRRIHAAREVHSNDRKIKSSRSYQPGRSAQAFEDLVSRLQVEDMRRMKKASDSTASSEFQLFVEPNAPGLDPSAKLPEPRPKVLDVDEKAFGDKLRLYFPRSLQRPISRAHNSVGVEDSIFESSTPESSAQSEILHLANTVPEKQPPPLPDDPVFDEAEEQKRQERLAYDVKKLLGEEPVNVEAAAARFLDTFAEGLPVGGEGLLPALMDVAIQLSNALRQDHLFTISNQVLDAVLLYPPIHKEQFDAFRPDQVIRSLLGRRRPNGQPEVSLNPDAIRKAASIYLTDIKEKSTLMSKPMLNLGVKLCRETCQSGMYSLTLEVFRHMDKCRGENPVRGVEHMVIATHKLGKHKEMFRSFRKFYSQTTPHELGHWKTINTVIDSLLSLGRFDKAEEVLVVATEMARTHNLTTSTTSILKVLGTDWRTYKNIERTRALFDRLEPLLSVSSHPEACYGAIIQFCVEANDEHTARSYYNSLQKAYKSRPINVSILGHFARAKALRQDWGGVEEDFREMRKLAPREHAEISASFTPVLKLFALSHSVGETEDFIRHFVNDLGVRITGYIMNLMVNIYAEGQEIESISRWVEFSSSLGCQVDSVFFNTMLNQCYDSWKFDFSEILDLYKRVKEIDRGSRFLDKDTTSMIRRIQVLSCQKFARKLERLDGSDKFDEVVNPRTVHSNMALALGEGDSARTLETYVKASNDGIPLDSQHLQLALQATLSLDAEDFDSCVSLIEHADRRGLDTSSQLCFVLFRQSKQLLETGEYHPSHFVEIYKKAISHFQKLGKPVPLALITHAMSFMKVYDNALPLKFWETMARQLNLSASSLDLPALTVFLDVYIRRNDAAGVKWTIGMLSNNNLTPDMEFFNVLKNESRRLTSVSIDGSYPRAKEEYLQQVVEAERLVAEMRKTHRQEKDSVKRMTINIIAGAIAKLGRKRPKWEDTSVSEFDKGKSSDPSLPESIWDEQLDDDINFPAPLAVGAVGC